MCKISSLVEVWKKVWMRERYYCLVSGLKRALTFNVRSAPGLNLGGLGNHLWLSIPTASPSPIFQVETYQNCDVDQKAREEMKRKKEEVQK